MEIVLKLLDWSLRQNWALGGPIVCFIVLMCIPALRNTADNPSDRAYWRDLLRHDRPAERYRSVMRRGLDWLDSRLSAMRRRKARRKGLGALACSTPPWPSPLPILLWPSQSNGSGALRLILAVRR
ncbi:hypothetical protein N8446_01395 [Planktomarina temperata]|nr:hypothetical protein [Planktomarina temperata]